MGWEYEDLIGTAILKFPERHEFVRTLRDLAESAGTDLGWSETGPSLLTRLAREHDLLKLVTPQAQSYPVQSTDALHLFIPAHREMVREKVNGKPFSASVERGSAPRCPGWRDGAASGEFHRRFVRASWRRFR
jgi:hypothetical protein